MRIRIDLKIFIFGFIFLLTHQIKIYSILMLFAIIHELGHLIAGVLMGLKPAKIEIMPYGLSIGFDVNYNDCNRKIGKGNALSIKRLIIASAGPITNFFIVLIFSFIKINLLGIERELLVYSNLLIGIFNLIPIYPLDGGRIIKEILQIICGLEKSYTYTIKISRIVVVILTAVSSITILYIKNIAIVIILAYLWYLVIMENRKYEKIHRLYKTLHIIDKCDEHYNGEYER